MQTDLTEQEIRNEVNRLAPFHHKVELPYNLSTHVSELSLRPVEYTRVSNLIKHAFPALMEVCGGSLQGKRVLCLKQMEFKVMNIESLDESTVGLFDVTFCFGILYHLENPIQAMKRLASVTKDCMLVDTGVIGTLALIRPFFKKPLWLMNFPAVSTAESKDVTTSLLRSKDRFVQFRPNEDAVVDLLKFLGFSKVEKIKPESGVPSSAGILWKTCHWA